MRNVCQKRQEMRRVIGTAVHNGAHRTPRQKKRIFPPGKSHVPLYGLKLLAAAVLMLALTACDFIATDTETLLRPPTLNKQQAEVYAALETTLNISDIVYKYPGRGDYRSPFVFYDMDGSGRKVAIVFYSYKNDLSSIRTKILRKEENGTWTPFRDLTTICDQIDFVQFSRMLSSDNFCLIIGWQNTGAQSSRNVGSFLGVYSFIGDEFDVEVEQQRYIDYTIWDFDGDGLEEVVVIDREQDWTRDQTLRLSLLREVGRHIAVTDSLLLSSEAESLLQMTVGRLWDSSGGAVYVDELRKAAAPSAATEVIRVSKSGLTVLAGGDPPENAEEENIPWENYTHTFRDDLVLCRDYNEDGVIEVPRPVPLPGNLYLGEERPLKLTELMQLTEEGFSVPQKAVINGEEGYLFIMPEQWLGWVSVLRDRETDEWKFFLLDPDTSDPSVELLRIQAYYEAGSEAANTAGSVFLGSRGARRFSGYIPLTTADVPSITERDLKALFKILS